MPQRFAGPGWGVECEAPTFPTGPQRPRASVSPTRCTSGLPQDHLDKNSSSCKDQWPHSSASAAGPVVLCPISLLSPGLLIELNSLRFLGKDKGQQQSFSVLMAHKGGKLR